MDPLTYAVFSFILVAGVTYVVCVLLFRWWSPVQRERLQQPQPKDGASSIVRWKDDRARAGWQRNLERLSRALGPRDSARLSRAQQRLVWAGYHDPRAVRFFIGAKVGCALLFGYAYTLYGIAMQQALPHVLPISVILMVLGFLLPNFWLYNRIRPRQRDVVNALPDVLDLLMVCVEAGMGFNAAVARIAEQPQMRQSPLHQELLRMHHEQRAGQPRPEALRAMGERTGVREVKTMVGAFIQTEQLGTSLGKTLRIHADFARVQRRFRAEERAHIVPVLMLFPTVLFLLPAFVLVIMAPTLLKLVNVLQAMGGVR
jgi:tight adherence protein C